MNDELIELPEGWEWIKISDVAEKVGSGSTPRGGSESYKLSGIPLIRSMNVHFDGLKLDGLAYLDDKQADELKNVEVKASDVLLNITGASIGRVTQAPLEMDGARVNQHVCIIRPNPILDAAFLSKYLASPSVQKWIMAEEYGATRQALTKQMILNFDIPLPPLNEQKRIITKIEELRDRHQRAKQALEAVPKLCDRFRQSVLAAAFRGDLTADWREQNPDVEPASVLLERIRSDRLQEYLKEIEQLKLEGKNPPKLPGLERLETELEVPETWGSIPVESACLFVIDCLHSTPKFVEEGEYCIDTTCIEPFKINWSKARKVSSEDFLFRTSRMLPRQNDILFSREGTIGTAVRVPGSPQICLGQRMMMFRFPPFILPEYAELYLQSPVFKKQYKPLILGTTSPHLNIGDIRKLAFLVPPLLEQKRIIQCVRSLLNKAVHVEQQYQDSDILLNKLNQSTLAKAFRGELVEQDPNDEPASVLLDRIRAEREAQQPNKASRGKGTGRQRKKAIADE
jgi:type I restriction enzyme, S subunit